MNAVPVCEWLRGKLLNSCHSVDADEIRGHVEECHICKGLLGR